MMKPLEETTSRRALLAMALSGAGVMAFPINIKQDKTSQDANVEAAKRFVGTWKGKIRPDMIADNVLVFKMEGERLKGTERQLQISIQDDGRGPQIIRDEYVPLPDLSVEGKILTWKTKWPQPDHESLKRVTLINDDEILFEGVGMHRSTDQPTLIVPISYKMKREK
jgi:hypothetical protein